MGVQRHWPGWLLIPGMVVMVLVLAGCTGDTDSAATHSQTPVPAPVLPMFGVESEPLWGTGDVGIRDIEDIQFPAQSAVLSGYDGSTASSEKVVVVNATTGAVQWSVNVLDELTGGNGAVLWDTHFLVGDSADSAVTGRVLLRRV